MESDEKERSTTLQVQQSIEHFKEQYLHSLGHSLSTTVSSQPSSLLSSPSPSVYVRRKSLSSVASRRDSLSSSSSQEENVLPSSGTQYHVFSGSATRIGFPSGCPAPAGNPRIHDCDSRLQPSASTGETFEDISDRNKFKDKYISSLGLLHKYRRQKSLPCLKDRVAEFEILMAKSAHMEVSFSNSKNSEQSNNSQNSQNSDQKHNTLSDDFHSTERSISGDSSTDTQTNSIDSNDHFQLTSDVKPTLSVPLHVLSASLSSSTTGNTYCYEAEIPNKEMTAEPVFTFGPRREIFENTTPGWDKPVNKHAHFTFEQPAIHKAYTEKEKAFILESMRKSGGRQQRTLSLGSCFNLQTETSSGVLTSKIPQQPTLPCKLTQSVTNIISQFEAVRHSEPRVQVAHADLHSKVRICESCDTQTHIIMGEYLSGKQQLQTVQLSCDNITDRVDLHTTHSVSSALDYPDVSFQEKDSVRKETFRETTDVSTENETSSVRLDTSDSMCRVGRMYQIPHSTEDDTRRNDRRVNSYPHKDVIALSHPEDDNANHTTRCLCLSNRCEQSLAEAEICNGTHKSCSPPVDIASEDLSDSESGIISRETRYIGSSNERDVNPHPHYDCIVANTEIFDACDVRSGTSQFLFNTASITDEEPSSLLINTFLENSQSEAEINSVSNTTENIATVKSAKPQVVSSQKPSVSTDVVDDRFRCFDENITAKNRERSKSLDDKCSLAILDAECKEGNLTTAVNRSLRYDDKKTLGETRPQQHCILPHCDVDEREQPNDLTDAIRHLDMGNQVFNTNNHKGNFEQKPNAKYILLDAPGDEYTGGCVPDTLDVNVSPFDEHFLGLNTFDSKASEQQVLSNDVGTRGQGDEVADNNVCTERRTISTTIIGLDKLSETDSDIHKCVEDICHESRDNDDVSSSRRYENSGNSDRSKKCMLSYADSKDSTVNLVGNEVVEKTNIINLEEELEVSADMQCFLQHGKLKEAIDSFRTSATESAAVEALPDNDYPISVKSDCEESQDYSATDYSEPAEQPGMPVCFRSHSDIFWQSGACGGHTFSSPSTAKVENFVASLVDSALLESKLHLSNSSRDDTILIESNEHDEATCCVPSTELNAITQVKLSSRHCQDEDAEMYYCPNTVLADTGDDRLMAARGKLSESVYPQHVSCDHINSCTLSCDKVSPQADCPSGMEVVNCLSCPVGLQNSFSGNSNTYCSRSGLDKIEHVASDLILDRAENSPVPKSAVFCARTSCSDISDSVDSFYSGSSEVAESFHSADDMEMFVDNSDHTYSTAEEVSTPVRRDCNGEYTTTDHISNNFDLYIEQNQCCSNSEDNLERNSVAVNRSDYPTDLYGSSSICWNERSYITTDNNKENNNCSDCEFDISTNLRKHDITEQGLFLDLGIDGPDDFHVSAHSDHAESDQSQCLNTLGASDDQLCASSTDIISVLANVVDVYINTVEESDTNNRRKHELSDYINNKKLPLDRVSEADVQKETEDSFCRIEGPDNFFQQTEKDQRNERAVAGFSQEYIFTESSSDTCTPDPGNDLWSEDVNRNRSVNNLPDSCCLHAITDFHEALSETAMSVDTFNTRVDNMETYPDHCNLTPAFITKENTGCQSQSLSDLHMVVKQCQESEENEIGDMFVDGTLFTEPRDRHAIDAIPGHADRDEARAECNSYIIFRDKACDNNTDSDDNESMDIDSLEENTDDNRKDRVVVDTGSPTTTTAAETYSTTSTSSGDTLSPLFSGYLQNESPPLCSANFVPKDEAQLSELTASKERELSRSQTGAFNHPMTLDQSLAPKQAKNTLSSLGHKSTIKEKRWKEAEDVATSRGNTSIRSPQKVTTPLHLDLATTEMTDLVQVDMNDILESPGACLHRISSTGAFQPTQPDTSRLDPYRFLERSQSDANLLKRDMEILATDDDVHLTAAESSSGQNISECNRVYLDLSRAEAFERVELGDSSGAMMRTSSGRLLETIPQDEELKTGDLSYVYASHRSFSQESSSSMEDLTFSPKTKNKDSAKYKSCGKPGQENSITCSKSSLRSSFQIYSHSLKQKVRQLQMGSIPEQLNALTELNVLMEQAWSMPIYGKDLAYELCDILRTESALDIIVSNLASTNRELMKVSARLLEQSLTTSNRRQVAENGLELVVKMAHDARGDCELAQICTGILESLFKTSEDTCARVIKLGGLDTITYWCRCNDRVTLKNCAIALSNLALYGGGDNQQEMAKHKVPEWLFPLAFVDDDSVRYYALLAIGVLVSNKEIENAVTSSGTLALVLPFIDSHDPAEFAERDTSHRHGRSPGWLKRLIPVLSSKREEAQALAAFHFVMEAGIKSEQGRKEVLYKIGAVDPLKWLASTPNRVASKLAAQALKIIGEEIPHKLSQQVPLWACDDVVHWIGQVGFGIYADKFKSCHVDGDLLLRLTEEELKDSLGMLCSITRKRFLRELRDIKISSDYTSCDPSMLGAWLQEVGEDMSQYTYQMLYQGVDRPLLRSISDSLLVHDCKIVNGIHRMKILSKIEELRSVVSSPSCPRCDSVDGMTMSQNPHKTPIDVFISYRRSNGSQLASLLKVHLQLRGFTVFIDIEKLRAGKFDESLLESVRQAKNFIIVLTQNSLDRCMGDDDKKDWVHREITAAVEAGSNIIPLLDNFKWPSPESLPEDMRSICYFNYVRWIHDYQDACVDKLEKFLRGETNPQQRHPVGSAASNSSSNNIGTATPTSKHTSGFESPNSPPYQRAQGMRKMSSVESPVDSS